LELDWNHLAKPVIARKVILLVHFDSIVKYATNIAKQFEVYEIGKSCATEE